VRLRTADARADERRHVPVAAVLAAGTGRERIPANITRPWVGAPSAAAVARSAARTSPGESARSPRMRRTDAALPRSRAATDASGGIVAHALGMCRAASPSAKL
jgi:hypothetical protein